MPKDTFFNLPIEKQNKIIETAIDEFAAYSYDNASINNIIDTCGIAKGSFYQYFENKKDLYKYIIKKAVQRKLDYLSPTFKNPGQHDFFTMLRKMYIAGLEFAKDNPKLLAVGNKFLADKENPIYKETLKENIPYSYELFEIFLKRAIERKEVRDDIDTKFVSYMISSLNLTMVEYYTEHIQKELDFKILETVDILLDFLENGIGTN